MSRCPTGCRAPDACSHCTPTLDGVPLEAWLVLACVVGMGALTAVAAVCQALGIRL